MRFFHLSDLHIGKRLHEQSLAEDQRYILDQILALCASEHPDALILAGDIYDKTVPSAEAVELFDDFLTRTAALNIPALVISGNHDSPERLHYGSRLLEKNAIYLEGTFRGAPRVVTLSDEHEFVDFYLLPFLKAAAVRPFFPDAEIGDEQDTVAAALSAVTPDPGRRNVLIAHQFVTGSRGEAVSVGASDNVEVSLFDDFDYVALGHLHTPQCVGRETVRYCGSPLKYSFAECSAEPSVTVVELLEKGKVKIDTLPLRPLHDVRVIRGPIDQLTSQDVVDSADRNDYICAILTDEEELISPLDRMRDCYPNLLRLDFDNRRTRAAGVGDASAEEDRPLAELFADFYEMQQGTPLDESRKKLVEELFASLTNES